LTITAAADWPEYSTKPLLTLPFLRPPQAAAATPNSQQ